MALTDLRINELQVSTTGTDFEFIELFGPAGQALDGVFLLVIESDPEGASAATSPGRVDRVVDFTGQTIQSDGLYLAISPQGATTYGVPSDGTVSIANDSFENSSATYLLVQGFTGAVGSDLDANNDGALDSLPWTALLDAVSLRDAAGDFAYGGPSFGPDGSSLPSGVFRAGGGGAFSSTFLNFNTPDGTPGEPNSGAPLGFSIDNVTQSEGDAGTTTFTFTVTRSSATGAASVDFATKDGSATAGSDYVAQAGSLNFADGEASKTIAITVNGDTAIEVNETFTVELSNPSAGYALADGQGLGTIAEDDIAVTRIHDIQGAQHRSPLVGQVATIQGIVTAVTSNGFYIQEEDADADADIATSEALFVFTNTAPPASVVLGNELRLTGTVSEFTPGGAATGNLSTTQLGNTSGYVIVSTGNALPSATVIGAGGRALPTENIEDDTPFDATSTQSFDAATDGMDFYESLEGMLVTVNAPRVVAGTNQFGEIFVVADDGTGATGLSPRGVIVIDEQDGGGLAVTNSGPGSDFNPERIQIDPDNAITPGANIPSVNAGAVLGSVTGVIGYDFGNYQLVPTQQITVAQASTLTGEVTSLVGDEDTLTIASYNVLNLDINDTASETQADQDLADGRFAAIAQQIINNLGSPDIIGLQEIQDNSGGTNDGVVAADQVLQALVDAIVAAGGPAYKFIDNTLIENNASGGQPGANIRNAFLYNDARVDLVAGSVTTTPNAAADFIGSRLPLVASFALGGEEVMVINNHFSSKGGSTPLYGTSQLSLNGSADERLTQAQNVADFVTSLGDGAKVVVLGDLNEFSEEESLQPLSAAGLTDLVTTLPQSEQYTYIFEGNAQVLDHIFTSDSLTIAGYDIVHVNIEFAFTDAAASDHDPSVVAIDLASDPLFTLQLLHFADAEAKSLAVETAPNLAALVDAFEDDYANSITLAGGDNYIPGLFFTAQSDASVAQALGFNGGPRVDIAIHNAIGVQASTIGNHEFDRGTATFASAIAPAGAYEGTLFPYLSANLDFSGDSSLNPLFTETLDGDLEKASDLSGRIVPSAVIEENGELIGLVGATTQVLSTLTSLGGVKVKGTNANDMALLAQQLQPYIDELRAQGVNKIIVMSHLQQIELEQALAPLLEGVDIILAAGSNTRLSDADDELVAFNGHPPVSQGQYPIVTQGLDGAPTLIVNTDNEFTYLGRLVVDFDAEGEIVLSSVTQNLAVNGAYASTTEIVAEAWGDLDGDLSDSAFADGTRGDAVQEFVDAVNVVLEDQGSNVYGYSEVGLEGSRTAVRGQETNLGNLTADANAAAAREALGLGGDAVVVSFKNGGGIRDSIGTLTGTGSEVVFGPNEGGVVTELDVGAALAFNNGLVVFDTTPQGLLGILNSPNLFQPGNGGFGQFSGLQVSYDPDLPQGSRVIDVALVDGEGNKIALVDDGQVVDGAPAAITVVTLDFIAGNDGDGTEVAEHGTNFRYLLVNAEGEVSVSAPLSIKADDDFPGDVVVDLAGYIGTDKLGEQRALELYLREVHGTPEDAFDQADTPQTEDERIQNVNVRADTVLEGVADPAPVFTSPGAFSVAENTLLAATLAAFDANDDSLTFAITGGADRDRFAVEATTGAITFLALPDFEMPTDVGLDNVYNLTVTASDDEGNIATQEIAITVTDVAEIGRQLSGGNGSDNLVGTTGDDIISGGNGDDALSGNDGSDRISGGNSNDTVNGGNGNDTIEGGNGNDIIDGGAGNDIVSSGNGNDTVDAGRGDDQIDGGNGDDVLFGADGNDIIKGGSGGDRIVAGAGDDVLSGGNGNDWFIFDNSMEIGNDIITDFRRGDRLLTTGDLGSELVLDGGLLAFEGTGSVQMTGAEELEFSGTVLFQGVTFYSYEIA